MSFVTDLLWRSPLGLRINAQATADVLMTEDWVRLRGDQLAPRDGVYDLRVTAELWETHFFDLVVAAGRRSPRRHRGVRRRALRRPAAEAAARRHGPRAAVRLGARRSRRRRDRARGDARFAPRRRRRPRRLPGDHAPALRRNGTARRRRRARDRCGSSRRDGSIRPTARSTSRSRRGRTTAPEGLSLHVADAAGVFREVRKGLGFPSGKDKTILLDLSGLFPPARTAPSPPGDEPGDLLGSAGMGGRASGRRDRAAPARAARARSWRFAATPSPSSRPRASPERPRYVLAGTMPPLARSRGLLHAVRRRARAAHGGRRPLRHHERGRRAAPAFPEAPPPARRAGARFRRRRRRLGEGRRLQHELLAHGAAAADASRADATTRRRRGWKTIRCTGSTRDDFAEYHTRYVTPDGGARRAAPGAPRRDRRVRKP